MKAIFNVSLFLFSFCSLSASNDSIPAEKKRSVPVSNARRIPTMSNSKSALPMQENPLKLPMRMQNNTMPQPQLEEFRTPGTGLITKGKSVEDELIDPWGFVLTDRHLNRWYRNITGLRVMVDYGTSIGFGKNANHRFDFYGSVGYQFNPIFFVGVGQGYAISLNKEESVMPTYIVPRVNFLDADTTPFFDLKFGYAFLGAKGFHYNPNFGFSFGRAKRAWNISVGYNYQKAKVKKQNVTHHYKYHGVVLRIGYEFNVF